MKSVLCTAYWPNLHYFYYVLKSETILIEQFDHYQKQSFRNRTQILSANGVLDLSIPVTKKNVKNYSKDIGISYSENWQNNHWRAITSAYKNSPYFEYFEDEIIPFYKLRYDNLLEYNLLQLKTLLKLLKYKKEIGLTDSFEKTPLNRIDTRELIHPKRVFEKDVLVTGLLSKPYYQTFENKFEFKSNLSLLDLLFNKGLLTLDYFND
jgi:hypothetical protein